MFSLQATIRQKTGKQAKQLRKQGMLPGVLYGEGIKENINLEVKERDFEEVFREAGETSIIKLKIKNGGLKTNEVDVLIHQIAKDPLSGRFLHIDFFHPSSKKKIEAEVPLVFEGIPPAQKYLGGVLVRELQLVEVKGLAHQLPREIKVDVSSLHTFEDRILVKDLPLPEGVEVKHQPDDIVVHVTPPTKMEEEKPKEEEKPTEGEVPKKGEEEKEEKKEGIKSSKSKIQS